MTNVATGPFPHRLNINHWSSTDTRFLFAPPKTQGHCRLRSRHPPHPVSLATDGFPHRIIRSLHPLRRLSRNNRSVRREHPGRRSLYQDGVGGPGGWQTERRAPGIITTTHDRDQPSLGESLPPGTKRSIHDVTCTNIQT
jgi:hypothetical protein